MASEEGYSGALINDKSTIGLAHNEVESNILMGFKDPLYIFKDLLKVLSANSHWKYNLTNFTFDLPETNRKIV